MAQNRGTIEEILKMGGAPKIGVWLGGVLNPHNNKRAEMVWGYIASVPPPRVTKPRHRKTGALATFGVPKGS